MLVFTHVLVTDVDNSSAYEHEMTIVINNITSNQRNEIEILPDILAHYSSFFRWAIEISDSQLGVRMELDGVDGQLFQFVAN